MTNSHRSVFPGIFLSALLSVLFLASPAHSFQIRREAGATAADEEPIVAVIHYDSPPTFYRDPETGQPAGFAVDVLNKITQGTGVSVIYIFGTDWSDMIKKVETGEADLVAGLGITEDRKKRLAYSETFDHFPVSLFVRTESAITGLQPGLTVGVPRGSVSDEYLQKQKDVALHLKQYDSYKAGLFDLLAGRIDAFSCPKPTLLALAREAGMDSRIRIAGAPVTEINRAFAVRKDNTLLLDGLNAALGRFVGTPEYQELYLKWYGKPERYWSQRKVVLFTSAAALLIITAMAVWRYNSIAKLSRTVVRNVAELNRAEKNRVRLETAIASAADAIVLTNERGTIGYVNPAFERMTGYAAREVIGRDLHILDSGRHDESYFKKIRESIKQQGVWTGRLVNRRKDNSYYEAECTYSTIHHPDKGILGYVTIKRDITEKLRLESVAAAVETMNNMGYIFSGVRHELGNPVNSLKLMLTMLQRKLRNAETESVEHYVDRCLSELSKVTDLLANLRSFTMFEKFEIQNVRIGEFFEKLKSLVTEDFGSRGIEIVSSIESAAEIVCCDPRALQQVLINLLTNAADAVQGSTAPRIGLHILKRDGMICMQVRDNGHGMTEEELQNLFKPFRTAKPQGTGLGLVIVKKMVTGMGGTVEVHSRKEEGTTVTLLLPERAGCRSKNEEGLESETTAYSSSLETSGGPLSSAAKTKT